MISQTSTQNFDEFFLDYKVLPPATKLNNVIKVPVIIAAEMVKYYSEHEKHLFMPYDELKDAVAWHNKNMPRLPITIDHVELYDKEKHPRVIDDSEQVGYVTQLEASDKRKAVKGWAYFTKSRLHPQIADALVHGHRIGVSVGGFNKEFGPPGFHKNQKYDASQLGLRFHHAALITIGLPRCPTNMCGFNFSDADFPWDECMRKMKKRYGSTERAKKICGSIKSKYGDAFDKIREDFRDILRDSSTCVSEKIRYLYHEYRKKGKKIDRDQIIAHAHAYCGESRASKDSFDLFAEKPNDYFREFHDSLINEGYIQQGSCVLDFWDAYRGVIDDIESDVINKEYGVILDNLVSTTKNEVSNKMSEDQLKILTEQIKGLKAENDELRNSKFADAEKQIAELRDANKQFADANAALNKEIEGLKQEVITLKQDEIKSMAQALIDSKRFTAEELKSMDYATLKSTYLLAKRFLDSSENTVYRPQQKPFSTLPRTPIQNPTLDSGNPLPARQYKIGEAPPMDVILDGDNDHWKPRFPPKPF